MANIPLHQHCLPKMAPTQAPCGFSFRIPHARLTTTCPARVLASPVMWIIPTQLLAMHLTTGPQIRPLLQHLPPKSRHLKAHWYLKYKGLDHTVTPEDFSYSTSAIATPVLRGAWYLMHCACWLSVALITSEQVKHYLEEWAVQQLFATSHDRIFIFKLPLQSFWKAFHQSSKSTAWKTLQKTTKL